MPSTSHVLDEAQKLLKERLAELDAERKRLEGALAELGGSATSTASPRRSPGRPAKKRRGPGRPAGRPAGSKNKASQGSKKAAPSRRRRRKGGTRADQAVALVEKSPGISASEIAKAMKIKPNYLYRVLGDLEQEGRIKKDGRSYRASA